MGILLGNALLGGSGGAVAAPAGSTIATWDPETTPIVMPGGAAEFADGKFAYRSGPIATFPYTVAVWFRTDGEEGGQVVWAHVVDNGGNPEGVYLFLTGTTARLISDSRASGYAYIGDATAHTITADAWHLAVCVVESAESIKLSIDNGAFLSETGPVAGQGTPAFTFLGGTGISPAGVGNHLVGPADNLCFWSRALSIGEVGTLFGGGSGIRLNQLDAGMLAGLIAGYDLDGRGGQFDDRIGENRLTPVGAPGIAEGIVATSTDVLAWDGHPAISCSGHSAADADSRPTTRTHYRGLELDTTKQGMIRVGEGLSGKTDWTYGAAIDDLVVGTTGARVYHHEKHADGTVLKLGTDAQGRPFVTATEAAGANPITVTCPVPAFGRASVTGGSTEDGLIGRTLCYLELDTILDLATADRVTIAGCGAPFDGSWTLDECRIDAPGGTPLISFMNDVVPYSGSSTEPTLGTVTPTSEVQKGWIPSGNPEDPSYPGHEPRRCRLIAVRDAGAGVIRWYEGTDLIGTASSTGLPLGAEGDVTVTVGGPGDGVDDGPARLPAFAQAIRGVASASRRLDLAVRLSGRVSGGYGMANEVCAVNFESLPGLARRQAAQAGAIAQVWIDDATGALIPGEPDGRTGDRMALCRADFSMAVLGEWDQATTTTHSLAIAYKSPRFDELGDEVESSWQFAGKVLTATRVPWPTDRARSVGSDKTYATIDAAFVGLEPETLIIVDRDYAMVKQTLKAGVGPYCVAAARGTGARPLIEQEYQAGIDWAGSCLEVEGGLGHATMTGFDFDMPHTLATDGSRQCINMALLARGVAIVDFVTESAGGGETWRASAPILCLIAGFASTGPAVEGAYSVYLGEGARDCAIRLGQLDRATGPGGAHILRSAALDTVLITGLSHRPLVEPVFGGSNDYTMRNYQRRVTWDSCECGDEVLSCTTGDTSQNPGLVSGSRVRITGTSCGQVHFQGISHGLVEGSLALSDGVNQIGGNDGGMHGTDCNHFLASTWVDSSAVTADQTVNPSSGDWRNETPATLATGNVLSAPGLDAVRVAGTSLWAVAPTAGAFGGTLPRSVRLVADEADAGTLGTAAVVKLTPGPHTLAASVLDDSGAAAVQGSALLVNA